MAEHTPGPWIVLHADADGLNDVLPAGRHGVIALDIKNDSDARLIAAAPDLLKAGMLLAEEVAYMLEECSDDARAKALHAWNAAFAKATGAA